MVTTTIPTRKKIQTVMTYDKDGAIEWMKARGYSHTATNGSEDLLYFLKKFPDGHIHLHATIWLKKQTVELDTTSVLDLGISLYCPAVQMDIMKFETFEERMYNYAYLCLYGKTNESGSKMGFTIPNPTGQIHTGQPSPDAGTESETIRGREPGGVVKAEGKASKPTTDERIKKFWDEVKAVAKQKGYPKELAVEFFKYWSEKNKSGTAFRREKETFFDIPKRFATWIKNNKAWSKQTFVEQKAEKQNEELKTRKPTLKHKELF